LPAVSTAGIPDVLGLALQRAGEVLAAAGRRVRLMETAPPRGPLAGRRRVVRQRQAPDGAVELIAAAQLELPEGP
jgi:hypothetical protein